MPPVLWKNLAKKKTSLDEQKGTASEAASLVKGRVKAVFRKFRGKTWHRNRTDDKQPEPPTPPSSSKYHPSVTLPRNIQFKSINQLSPDVPINSQQSLPTSSRTLPAWLQGARSAEGDSTILKSVPLSVTAKAGGVRNDNAQNPPVAAAAAVTAVQVRHICDSKLSPSKIFLKDSMYMKEAGSTLDDTGDTGRFGDRSCYRYIDKVEPTASVEGNIRNDRTIHSPTEPCESFQDSNPHCVQSAFNFSAPKLPTLDSEAYKSVLWEIKKQNDSFQESWKRLEQRLDRLESVLSSVYKKEEPFVEGEQDKLWDFSQGFVVKEAESLDLIVDLSNVDQPVVAKQLYSAKGTVEPSVTSAYITSADGNGFTVREWTSKQVPQTLSRKYHMPETSHKPVSLSTSRWGNLQVLEDETQLERTVRQYCHPKRAAESQKPSRRRRGQDSENFETYKKKKRKPKWFLTRKHQGEDVVQDSDVQVNRDEEVNWMSQSGDDIGNQVGSIFAKADAPVTPDVNERRETNDIFWFGGNPGIESKLSQNVCSEPEVNDSRFCYTSILDYQTDNVEWDERRRWELKDRLRNVLNETSAFTGNRRPESPATILRRRLETSPFRDQKFVPNSTYLGLQLSIPNPCEQFVEQWTWDKVSVKPGIKNSDNKGVQTNDEAKMVDGRSILEMKSKRAKKKCSQCCKKRKACKESQSRTSSGSLRRLSSHSLEDLILKGRRSVEVVLNKRLDKERAILGVPKEQFVYPVKGCNFVDKLVRRLKPKSGEPPQCHRANEDALESSDRVQTERRKERIQPLQTKPSDSDHLKETNQQNANRTDYKRNSERKEQPNNMKRGDISGVIVRSQRDGKNVETFLFNPLWSRGHRTGTKKNSEIISELFPSLQDDEKRVEIYSSLKLRTPDGQMYRLNSSSLDKASQPLLEKERAPPSITEKRTLERHSDIQKSNRIQSSEKKCLSETSNDYNELYTVFSEKIYFSKGNNKDSKDVHVETITIPNLCGKNAKKQEELFGKWKCKAGISASLNEFELPKKSRRPKLMKRISCLNRKDVTKSENGQENRNNKRQNH